MTYALLSPATGVPYPRETFFREIEDCLFKIARLNACIHTGEITVRTVSRMPPGEITTVGSEVPTREQPAQRQLFHYSDL